MKDRNTNVPASYLVLLKGNQILLIKRSGRIYDGMYSIVAGHVEKGESFTDAIIRESLEEAGIVIDRDKLKVGHIQHRKSEIDGSERVHTYFVCTEWKGEIQNKEPNKCSEIGRFDMDDLPENMVDCVRFSIENIRKGIFYSEFGW